MREYLTQERLSLVLLIRIQQLVLLSKHVNIISIYQLSLEVMMKMTLTYFMKKEQPKSFLKF